LPTPKDAEVGFILGYFSDWLEMPMAGKLAEKRRIGGLEGKRDKMKAECFTRRADIRAEVEALLDTIQESLKGEPTLTPLFALRREVA
jgi:hypothetical protein